MSYVYFHFISDKDSIQDSFTTYFIWKANNFLRFYHDDCSNESRGRALVKIMAGAFLKHSVILRRTFLFIVQK